MNKNANLLPLYLRREPSVEMDSAGRCDVVAYSERADAKAGKAKARWLWHQSTKPTRRNRRVMLNCYAWRVVWLRDAVR